MADTIDVFKVLQKHRVPFVVIGGHAVNAHGFLDLEQLEETHRNP